MVPRLRHRIGIETLRRELDAVHASQAAAANYHSSHHLNNHNNHARRTSSSSSSSIVTVEDTAWTANGYLNLQPDITNGHFAPHNNAAVGDKIPGYRTSAAFLSSLRTNLRLNASPPPSPMSTPPSMHASASFLPGGAPEPSPLVADISVLTPPQTPTNPLEGVPDLTTFITTDDDEKIAALKLVSDSIAQMRQTASSILIYNPANIAIFVVLLGLICQRLYKDRSDTGIVFTTAAGVIMAALVFVRWLTGGYLFAAEDYAKLAPEILENADVIVTKFGDEVIGAVILGWKGVEPGKGGSSPKDSQRGKRRKWRAEIGGWAVRLRYRSKGCGGDLLEEAVQVARVKGAESVGFADDHANSKRVLWNYYNAAFDKKERLARAKLQSLWENSPKSKKR